MKETGKLFHPRIARYVLLSLSFRLIVLAQSKAGERARECGEARRKTTATNALGWVKKGNEGWRGNIALVWSENTDTRLLKEGGICAFLQVVSGSLVLSCNYARSSWNLKMHVKKNTFFAQGISIRSCWSLCPALEKNNNILNPAWRPRTHGVEKVAKPTNLNQNSGFWVKFDSIFWDSGTFLTPCVRDPCFLVLGTIIAPNYTLTFSKHVYSSKASVANCRLLYFSLLIFSHLATYRHISSCVSPAAQPILY